LPPQFADAPTPPARVQLFMEFARENIMLKEMLRSAKLQIARQTSLLADVRTHSADAHQQADKAMSESLREHVEP